MGVYKAKEGKTKVGRVWFFKLRYQDLDGRNKQYNSGKYATKKEVELAFRMKLFNHENQDKITLDEMIDLFVDKRTLSVNKQIIDRGGGVKSFEFSIPKTRSKEPCLLIKSS